LMSVADDVKDQVVKTATDIKDRGEDAVERVTLSVSEARDRALEDDIEDDLEDGIEDGIDTGLDDDLGTGTDIGTDIGDGIGTDTATAEPSRDDDESKA
jgi:hypothetical protein